MIKIHVGHSPDADDAFMFYALAHKKIDTRDMEFEHVLKDIETLNRWAVMERKLEVTALSAHAYAFAAEDYALLPHGASIGDRYGPIVVALQEMTLSSLRERTIAVPGELTTAFLALRLCLGADFAFRIVPFDQIFNVVMQGEAAAGLIIHEGQLTYSSLGFKKILDLGEWWYGKTQLPLPLGVNAIRKNLGKTQCARISGYLRESINYALAHHEEAMQYAMQFSRNTPGKLTEEFVRMYVNDFTREYGERGREALSRLLMEGNAAGVLPPVQLEFV